MDYLIFGYKWNSRELRKIITAILKSWIASNVKKLNYVQDYCLNDKKIEKTEQKLLLVYTDDYAKLTDFLSKNFSQLQEIKIG